MIARKCDRRDRVCDRLCDRQNPRRYWDVTYVTGFPPARVHVQHPHTSTIARTLAYTRYPLSHMSHMSHASTGAGLGRTHPVTNPVTRALTLSHLTQKEKKEGKETT